MRIKFLNSGLFSFLKHLKKMNWEIPRKIDLENNVDWLGLCYWIVILLNIWCGSSIAIKQIIWLILLQCTVSKQMDESIFLFFTVSNGFWTKSLFKKHFVLQCINAYIYCLKIADYVALGLGSQVNVTAVSPMQ